jgi:hypothetical protein
VQAVFGRIKCKLRKQQESTDRHVKS